jgi:hypothetical protein
MRFWHQAYKEWQAEDPEIGPDAPEVWEMAANLAVKDEAREQFAFSFFFELSSDEQELWLQYARRALSDGDSLDDKALRREAGRIAFDASEGLPLPQGMCRYRVAAGIGVCPEASAFHVTFDGCPTCGDSCSGHHLCEGHLESLMDSQRAAQNLRISDYTPLKEAT